MTDTEQEKMEAVYRAEWIRLLDILLGWPAERTEQWIQEKEWLPDTSGWIFHDEPQYWLEGLLMRELLGDADRGTLPWELTREFGRNPDIRNYSAEEVRKHVNQVLAPHHVQLPTGIKNHDSA